nr:reverse transcriptase domain-containing protein [Tanacetum cinerariifolium]
MRTRSQSRNNFPQQEASPVIVEPLRIELLFLEDQFQEYPPPEVPMADNRTMTELLQAPTEGYEDFFPLSKTTNLRNEITRFQQRFDELFYEAWDHFNDLLRACPHHGFSELHQLDTFYNALNVNNQDSLNSAAGGNFLDKMPRECLKIIKSKSKVRQSRAKAVVAKVSMSSSTPAISFEMSQIVLLAVVLTRTKIVPLQAETFIETTSKSMCRKPSQQITTKETPVSDHRWLQIKFDLPVFLPIKIIKTILIGGTILIKTEVTQSVSQTDFESYIKAIDVVLRNMQNQGQNVQNQCQSLQIQMANLTDMMSKFVSSNTASSSGSGTLPSNTITNPKEKLNGITTRVGVAYQGPTIPTLSKQETEVTKDQVQTPSSQSTAPVQPPVIQPET